MDARRNQHYEKELLQKAENLDETGKKLAKRMIKIIQNHSFERDRHIRAFNRALNEAEQGPAEKLSLLVQLAHNLLGKPYEDVMAYIVSYAADYPYSEGYERRPYRTRNMAKHMERVLEKCISLFDLGRFEGSVVELMTNENEDVDTTALPDLLAFELDRDNQQVMEFLRMSIYGDNNTAFLTRGIIKGLFLSHRQEAYQMAGELLVAARLQEGLRQSIVETMDEGTLEGTVHLLKVILEENLIRYSSVIRALDVWTGLTLEAESARVAKQTLQYVHECLINGSTRNEWLQSEDANKLYISLWASAVIEEEDAEQHIALVMKTGKRYQKIVALFLLLQSQNETLKYAISSAFLEETDQELRTLLLENYPYDFGFTSAYNHRTNQYVDHIYLERVPSLEDKAERMRQFSLFREMLSAAPKKPVTFPSKVFKDIQLTYSADAIASKMMYLASYDKDPGMISVLMDYKDWLSSETRGSLLDCFVSGDHDENQRKFIFACLSDRSNINREKALAKAAKLKLTSAEIKRVEELLKLKSGNLRQQAIKLLLKLDEKQLNSALDSLLTSKSEGQHVGALEILHELKEAAPNRYQHLQDKLKILKQPSPKEQILIDKLFQQEEHSLKNGFNLFDPAQECLLTVPAELKQIQLIEVFSMTKERIFEILTALSNAVHEHREFQYKIDWYGSTESLVLGAELRREHSFHGDGERGLASLPFSEVWGSCFKGTAVTVREALELALLVEMDYVYRYFHGKLEYWERSGKKRLDEWRKEFLESIYPLEKAQEFHQFLEELAYGEQLKQIITAFFEDCDRKEVFPVASGVLYYMIEAMPAEMRKRERGILEILTEPWQQWTRNSVYDVSSFSSSFFLAYKLYAYSGYKYFVPPLDEFLRAYEMKLIDENELIKEILVREDSRRRVYEWTNPKERWDKKYPSTAPLKEKVISRILEIELKRGDLPTEMTFLASEIQYFEGMEYFAAILTALDKETFVRGYIYLFNEGSFTKKESLSHLLRVCHPKPEETLEGFATLIQGKNISDKRLLEAAMYAPQWIDMVAAYLNWEGLKSAAWYFHAHINEAMSPEKETTVARYSPIFPEEFNDGAFDINWFTTAYETLGEERFRVLYECAKYISSGANHRRAQLFADAALGRVQLDDLKKSVIDKRNKDHLLCYSLVPLVGENPKEILERYQFIQQFLKESRQFGAMRRESEAKSVHIALDNLARNGGYKDVTRLRWEMEARQMDELAPYLEPLTVDDLTAQLVIDEYGRASLTASKNDKLLKNIPAKYKKHEKILLLKEISANLKDQYNRAKRELETSMEKETAFSLKELTNMMKNPVIAPLVKTLVFKAGRHLGFIQDETLEDAEGKSYHIQAEDEIVIAHPVHLFESGSWSGYQRILFERKLKQPFKQVFRELYLPNGDEQGDEKVSRRYAGHQIQPRKALALLKNRLWTVNYEEGLQKVFYKENIIATIQALSDWFSPSDIENPTIEGVEFFDRQSHKAIQLTQIPKVIFSETMRDVDLVVSVAHAGGVDPEASLTTIEMRKVILLESLHLMKLDNVRAEGNFAHISGQFGDYNVHLGSGTVFKQGKGAIHIVPVHSQHRGRLFLPFLDEDPKTAEILSKTVLLANDAKIKDPHILEQIRS
ncbi:DUF4132 domain-containing protein [Mesobacillus campisalis]|uniref:DUF4132 domain-containing protein n=1 Tax=Mesobacillus campisalis TaxID=1408103 RepID=UPI00069A1A05|nr:DUF4132 domain-containing protein [Mesobacillus campisalis]